MSIIRTLEKPEVNAALRTLIANGLTFGACVEAFGGSPSKNERIYIEAAKNQYGSEGECEIDELSVVSESDDGGAYVMAWVWVSDSDIWEGETDSDDEPCRFINHYCHVDCDECEL